MASDFLLYGSNGYTGRLIADRAVQRGLRPLLAGRSADEVGRQAAELGLEHRIFALEDTAALDAVLAEVPVVLHAAGPFSRTALPMADACLRTRTHYLDITGEIEVFEALAARGPAAAEAGVTLLPGVGFDVVPSDCLAAHLKRCLPGAVRLALAFTSEGGGISRGTRTTMAENLGRGGAIRRGGRIVSVPAAWRTRVVDFGRGPVPVTTIPWGDVATAFHSTGIPDVEVYTRMSRAQRRMLTASRFLGPVLRASPVRRWIRGRVRSGPAGPTAEQRERGQSLLWGEVEDAAGGRAEARLRTPEGYRLTAVTAVAAVAEVLAGRAPSGFQTPSLAFGADWVLDMPGVERTDVA